MILSETKNEEIITHNENKDRDEIITHKENKVEDKTKNVDKIILRENDCTGDTLSKLKQLIENIFSNAKNETCCLIESSNMRNKRQ
jgi:hypothetical protein